MLSGEVMFNPSIKIIVPTRCLRIENASGKISGRFSLREVWIEILIPLSPQHEKKDLA